MMFTNLRSLNQMSQINKSNVIMKINNTKQVSMNLTNVQKPNVINQVQYISSDKNEPDMTWGAPVWTFLHTISEKIKEEEFNNIKGEIFEIIVKVCSNLPCPECTRHASEYMKKINFNKITSKRELKLMLYTFHNSVNQRKNVKEYPLLELDNKYASVNTIEVFNKFAINLEYKRSYVHVVLGEIQRKSTVKKIKQWLIDNLHVFNT